MLPYSTWPCLPRTPSRRFATRRVAGQVCMTFSVKWHRPTPSTIRCVLVALESTSQAPRAAWSVGIPCAKARSAKALSVGGSSKSRQPRLHPSRQRVARFQWHQRRPPCRLRPTHRFVWLLQAREFCECRELDQTPFTQYAKQSPGYRPASKTNSPSSRNSRQPHSISDTRRPVISHHPPQLPQPHDHRHRVLLHPRELDGVL